MFKFFSLMLRLFAGKGFIMFLGLVLTILSFGSSLGLLTLSTWFLASCYLAKSIDFNIFYPSSSVRGFAIARTALKYIQRLVTHKATFDVLTKLRIQIFASLLPLATDIKQMSQFKSSTTRNTNKEEHKKATPRTGKEILNEVRATNASNVQQKAKTPNIPISDNELFDRILKDIDNLDGFYVNIIIPFLGTLLLFIGFTIGLSFISPALALVVGGSLTLVTLIVPWIFYPLGKKISANIELSSTKLRLAFLNYLELQFETLIFAKQEQKTQQLETLNQELIQQQLKRDRHTNLTTLILQLLLGVLLTVAIFGASYLQVLHATDLRFPGLATIFIFLVVGAIEFIIPLASLFLHLGQIIASAKNLETLLANKDAADLAQHLIDVDLDKAKPHHADTSKLYPQGLEQDILAKTESIGIKVSNLNFTYNQNAIINNLNVSFAPGQTYLISGDSGLGKTTFLNCLIGLEQSYTGNIEFDLYQQGQVFKTIDANSGLQRQLCVHLSQRVHIFNDSLFDNLKIANPDLTPEQAKQVLTTVGLDYLAENLGQILGNGGRSLSGGEIRRIGIARVLLSPARLIVLDEPTESIDSDIEKAVLEAIFSHAQQLQATVILVSHNKNNYSYCQHLLKMQKLNNTTILA
ncbi:amino acid ABC transporter ATP-binding/permease protein [Psittacicella hinzii]|uniref:ATP-binding cassette subfamily C protein CydC n=1 Tax=Psittacicella hinzii TaxID=2028575 RepID=A0A3A1YR98_9GAMM|nr:ATP-binding cassette domain-containing protein [Psittacicella hinzii]RIY40175.1 hypothetical protein CKF58_00910 [Psittacicella hinzii]